MHKIGQSAGKTWAYLLGVYLGDGCVYNHQGYLAFRLNSIDKDFVEAAKVAVEALSDRKTQLNGPYLDKRFPKAAPHWEFRSGDAKLCEALREETKDKKFIPDWLFTASKDERLAFIAGLMDSEGFVSVKNGRHGATMGFKSTDLWFDDFLRLLQSVGIRHGKIGVEQPREPHYRVPRRISIKIQSWIDAGAYFRIGRKQCRVEEFAALPYKRPPRNLRGHMSGASATA
jgi:hypothetical protein